MSIIKNRVGSSTDVTIMKLEKGVALASPPLPSGHPLLGYTAKLYLQLKAYSFQLGFYPRAGETVIIRAALDPGATGVIYGIEGSSGRCIKAENGYIRWYNGDTVVLEKAIDGEVHNFGYQGYDDEGTLKCRPYYDKENMSSIAGSTAQSTTVKAYVCAGTASTPSNVLTSSGSWAIRIYEIAASSYPDSTDTSQYHFHYYAAINPSSVACLMETRHDLVGVVGSGTTKSVTDFASVGYGIQLHDLKWITGSGYNDLMAIITEDGGLAASEADGVDHIRNSGMTIVRDFAIRLADGRDVNVSNPMPVPSGFTITRPNNAYKGDFDYRHYIGSGSVDDPNNYSGFLPYVKGDLIYGRKPNWPIWADGITWGKYVEGRRVMKADVNMFYQNLYFLRFNIFKDFKGVTISDLLERWHGLNTGAVHAPSAQVLAGVTIDFHNRVTCKCDFSTALTGMSGTRAVAADDKAIFKYSFGSENLASVKVGNLAPWNIPRAQQTGGDYHWFVRGVLAEFIYEGESHKYVVARGSAFGSESDGNNGVALFAKESTTDKTAFRDNGVILKTAGLENAMSEGLYGIYSIDFEGILASVSQANLPTNVKLSLLSGQPSEEITEMNAIHLDYLLPKIGEQDLVCNNDPVTFKQGTATSKSRFLAGEYDGKVKIGSINYDLQIYRSGTASSSNVDWDCSMEYYEQDESLTLLGKGIGAAIGAKAPDSDGLANLNTNPVLAFMDYRFVDTITQDNVEYNIAKGRYVSFVDCEDLEYPGGLIFPRWNNPVNVEGLTANWGLQRGQYGTSGHLYPSGISIAAGSSAGNENNVRMALFRWKDIIRSGASRDYWHAPYKSGQTMYPATAHLRVFEKNNGPVAWDIDVNGQNNGIDAICGQQYIQFQKSGTYYRFYFLTEDRVMPKENSMVQTLIKSTFTAWKEISAGNWIRFNHGNEGSVDYNIGGINVYIDEIPLHNAHTEAVVTTVAQFSNVVPGSSLDNNGFHLTMSEAHYNADFAWLPSLSNTYSVLGERGSGLRGFFDIKVTLDMNSHASLWHPGSLYVLRFEDTTTYTNQHYDGTSA